MFCTCLKAVIAPFYVLGCAIDTQMLARFSDVSQIIELDQRIFLRPQVCESAKQKRSGRSLTKLEFRLFFLVDLV